MEGNTGTEVKGGAVETREAYLICKKWKAKDPHHNKGDEVITRRRGDRAGL